MLGGQSGQSCAEAGLWVTQLFWEGSEQSLKKSPAPETYRSSLAGDGYLCLCI